MYVYTGRGRGSRSRSRGDDRLRPVPARTIQCRVDGVDALTPILRERGVVDDDLEVALVVLLVAERVPASVSRVTDAIDAWLDPV